VAWTYRFSAKIGKKKQCVLVEITARFLGHRLEAIKRLHGLGGSPTVKKKMVITTVIACEL
jgi:hypothetical protein